MNDTVIHRRAALWTDYWATGASHSLGQGSTTYGGDVARFWTDAFAALPAGARVLDIATGNGPLPRLLLATPGRDDLQCDAIDLAQVRPGWWAELPAEQQARVRIHPGCDAAALPFEAGSFDLAISQWGLEYTDLARALPELLRVLKPQAQICLVLHHQGGQPVRLAVEELGHGDWLAAGGGLLEMAQALVSLLALARTEAGRARLKADPQANATRERYNTLMDELDARASGSPCPDLLNEVADQLGQILNRVGRDGEAAAIQALQALRASLQDSRVRLEELVSHALDEAGARRLASQLTSGSYRLGELAMNGQLLGWTLALTREG